VPKIRVLIADDHGVLRAGLQLLINAQLDMEVVGQAATNHEALLAVQKTRPDVLIQDLTLSDGSGVPTIARVRQECPQTRVLVLTVHDDAAYLRAAFAAGAVGFVVKTAADTELLSAIRAVSQDRIFVDLKSSPSFLQAARGVAAASPKRAPPDDSALSRREREVLELLAQGHTNQEAADRLFLSVKTVETYRTRVAEKLGLRTRADLVRYAVEMGLLRPSCGFPEDRALRGASGKT
jgi:two-component system, NarL family, response regulator NreC